MDKSSHEISSTGTKQKAPQAQWLTRNTIMPVSKCHSVCEVGTRETRIDVFFKSIIQSLVYPTNPEEILKKYLMIRFSWTL